ncbi:MAG: Phage lysin, N-acetylmuramoyl-L-alanine amidase [Candidatus Ozemobacter sibiricus]|jgi:hypothetical protein|uniref:Phage lysin, N-acetylmuramoyl-L-alanine amidase n=1 Tax=Candidatus Ozemobacter sibiricus TaxID=2268124 RepID=A0A367ZNK7_9BACT|nr:MAG: Phage lysin, N-acetylmuramoyl-L-alanine amidase [Candidatus Ozemobacter sibiricus]
MEKRSRVFLWGIGLIIGVCLLGGPARADEDPATYRVAVNLGFQLEGQVYGQFRTPVYLLEPALDNLLISVEARRAPDAVIRSYVRFRDQKTGTWTRFHPFDTEFHFADPHPISAYQLLFIILDLGKGQSAIARFTAQGRCLGEATMTELLKTPLAFQPARPWPKPKIVSREEWKARPPKGEYKYHTPQKIVVHHTWKPTASQYVGAATIRGIQNYHMDDPNTGWSDIGYHFLIGPDGVIYQGRPEQAVGAHCPPNTTMVGVNVIGNYDAGQDPITPDMEKSLIELLSWLASTYKIDPRTQFYGHRDFSPKSCPGDQVYERLPQYRETVLANIGELKPH